MIRWSIRGVILVLALLVVAPGVGAAETAIEAGWWWRVQHGAGGPDLPAAASGVLAGQFPVEYSGNQATARTAFELPLGDAEAAVLVLELDLTASLNPGGVAVVACPSTDGWNREEGGRWPNQPLFDCSVAAVGEYDDQTGTVRFDLVHVLRFAREGLLNLILTPALDTSTPSITPPLPEEPEADAWRIVTTPLPGGVVLQSSMSTPPLSTPPPATPPPASPPPAASPSPAESSVEWSAQPSRKSPPIFSVPDLADEVPPEVLTPEVAPPSSGEAAPVPVAPTGIAADHARTSRSAPEPRWGLGLLFGLVGLSTYLPLRLTRDRISILQSLASEHAEDTPALAVEGLRVQFGGVRAVDDVSFAIERGQIVGLIGPNGAGKTTVLDAITGTVPATGRVEIDGVDVSAVSTAARCSIGLGRSFQDGRLFPSLSVRDTLSVALEQHTQRLGPITGMLGVGPSRVNERAIAERVDELLGLFGLNAFADKFVSELSTGSRRMVDLAAQVAHGATVLLLDEPSSGIAQRETEALGPVLLRLRDQLDATIVLIEHDMPLIQAVADRIIALEVGQIIADGTAHEVVNDPRVVDAYLGTDDAAINRSGVVDEPEVAV